MEFITRRPITFPFFSPRGDALTCCSTQTRARSMATVPTHQTAKVTQRAHLSQLSSTDPDLDLSPRQRLADYSESLVSDFESECPSSGEKIMTILGVIATLLLLGSALWCRSVEGNQSYLILEEAME